MAEAGIGWVPFMVQSLDNHAKRLKEGRRLIGKDGEQANLPAMDPSAYFHCNIWITFEDDAVTVQARARFKEGVDHYDKGQFENARLSFLQAYALKKHPAVLLNLAQSSAKATVTAATTTASAPVHLFIGPLLLLPPKGQ